MRDWQAVLAKNVRKYRQQRKLTQEQLSQAGGTAYTEGNHLTSSGRELYAATARSWERYLALNPKEPSLKLAKRMVAIFDEEGLNQPANAVIAYQIIVAAEPQNAAAYTHMAEFAYKAKNNRVGDLAARKAVELAPAAERTRLKRELEALKKGGGEETLTGTTNGKTFTVKKNAAGGYSGIIPSTTGTTTTKK